jgi:hypothetical protein
MANRNRAVPPAEKNLSARVSFLESRALQLGQVPHLIYSSERFNTWAHPVQRCPGQRQAGRTRSQERSTDVSLPVSEGERKPVENRD